jgi:hypothetical protein
MHPLRSKLRAAQPRECHRIPHHETLRMQHSTRCIACLCEYTQYRTQLACAWPRRVVKAAAGGGDPLEEPPHGSEVPVHVAQQTVTA